MISSWPILSIITFLPLCGALFAFFIPSKNDESTNINYNQNIKLLALWTMISSNPEGCNPLTLAGPLKPA